MTQVGVSPLKVGSAAQGSLSRRADFLSIFTVGSIFLLMVWGNVVSSTGSGLACPDWPLCHGTLTPPARGDIILEWGHRILAFMGSLLILASGWRFFASRSEALKPFRRLLFIFLGVQVLLGGITVLLELSPLASTLHLLIASCLFGALIWMACLQSGHTQEETPPSKKFRRLVLAGLGSLLVQFALGGLVRHHHLGLACPRFPLCIDSFFPLPLTFGTLLAFFHRWWGIALLGVFFHLQKVAQKELPGLKRVSQLTWMIALSQVVFGILTVLTSLHTHTRATHAALGYALWGLLVYLGVRSGALPAPASSAEGLSSGSLRAS